ncbi:MAG: DUF3054 domain-containing protein [Armatimonadota bacterium]
MRWGWLIWDAVALLAFTLIGMYSHHMPYNLPNIARTLIPFSLGWFGMALLLGLYRPSAPRWVFPTVLLAGVTLGVALRAWVFAGRGVSLLAIHPTFLMLSLLFVGLFTGLPRLLVSIVHYIQQVRHVRQS